MRKETSMDGTLSAEKSVRIRTEEMEEMERWALLRLKTKGWKMGDDLSHKENALFVYKDLHGKCHILQRWYLLVLRVASWVVSNIVTISQPSAVGLSTKCRWESCERLSSRDTEVNWKRPHMDLNFQFWWRWYLLYHSINASFKGPIFQRQTNNLQDFKPANFDNHPSITL